MEDDDGLLRRAARCDGTHDQPTLATRRLIVHAFTLDCCPQHLADVLKMAAACGITYRLEPTVDDERAVAVLRDC